MIPSTAWVLSRLATFILLVWWSIWSLQAGKAVEQCHGFLLIYYHSLWRKGLERWSQVAGDVAFVDAASLWIKLGEGVNLRHWLIDAKSLELNIMQSARMLAGLNNTTVFWAHYLLKYYALRAIRTALASESRYFLIVKIGAHQLLLFDGGGLILLLLLLLLV